MTEDKVKEVIADLETVCRKHNVSIIGTCDREGIYGEITIHELGTAEQEWRNMERIENNLSRAHKGDWQVDAIGNEPI